MRHAKESMEKKRKDLTIGNPAKQIMELAIPIMLSNVFQQFYTIADSAIIGRGVGSMAFAAVGATDWLNWTMSGSIIIFTTGFSVLAAQRFGEKDERGLRKTIAMIAILSAVIAAIFTSVSVLFMRDILRLLHTPENLFEAAYSYIRTIYLGTFAVMAFNAMAAILRALGNSKTPFEAQLLASLVNIVLDLIFIYRFHWGIIGAASATVLAQTAAMLYCLWFLIKQPDLFPRKTDWRIDKGILKSLLMLGLPMFFRNLLISFGGILMQTVVNLYRMEVVAGYTATNKLYGCVTVASVSYGHAFCAYTGQNYGAKNEARIKEGFQAVVWISIATSVFISVLLVMFGKQIVSVFISAKDIYAAEITTVAHGYLYRYAVFLIFLYLEAILTALLEGIGITRIQLTVGLFGLVTRIVLVESLPLHMGVTGLFYPETAAWAAESMVLVIYCLWNWKKIGMGEKKWEKRNG